MAFCYFYFYYYNYNYEYIYYFTKHDPLQHFVNIKMIVFYKTGNGFQKIDWEWQKQLIQSGFMKKNLLVNLEKLWCLYKKL